MIKIILYVILIAVVAAVAYGLYVKLSSVDFSGVKDTVNTAFNSVSNWFSETFALLS